MHKLEEKEGLMCKLCDLQEKFLCAIESQMGNLASLDAKEAGEVVDIIKDLSETQYYITKSAYYEEVVKAMNEAEEMKYNKPKDHESYGFKYPPSTWTEPIRMEHRDWEEKHQKYGEPYMNYKDARRFYTETHSETDKRKMDEHAKEHLHDTIDTMKDIWKDADSAMKQKMKQDLTNLINEMNG